MKYQVWDYAKVSEIKWYIKFLKILFRTFSYSFNVVILSIIYKDEFFCFVETAENVKGYVLYFYQHTNFYQNTHGILHFWMQTLYDINIHNIFSVFLFMSECFSCEILKRSSVSVYCILGKLLKLFGKYLLSR